MGWLSTLFAKRYLKSKKSHSVINIISRVSSFAIGVPVAAMVILLSVFNGFEGIVKQIYTDFDPDIKIESREGKVFGVDTIAVNKLWESGVVEQMTQVLEDNALLEYNGRQYIGTVRGVDSIYNRVVPIEKMVIKGSYELTHGEIQQTVIGQGIAYNLGVRQELYDPIKVMTPKRGGFRTLLPIDSYSEKQIYPEGVFQVEMEIDGKYIITSIEFARELFEYEGAVTALMVKLKKGVDPQKGRAKIEEIVGGEYRVLTRYQQNESVYRMMTYEKWAIFVIILMVLIIASFSIMGSLMMLIIDKKEQMRVLLTMGGTVEFVREIFIKEGMLIAMIGAGAGVVVGLIFCWVQATFGVIAIPAQTFLVDSYPVVVKATDVVVVVVAMMIVTYVITKITVVKAIKKSEIRM